MALFGQRGQKNAFFWRASLPHLQNLYMLAPKAPLENF